MQSKQRDIKRQVIIILVMSVLCGSLFAANGKDFRKYIGKTLPPDSERVGDLAKDGVHLGGGIVPWAKNPNLLIQWLGVEETGLAVFLVERVPPPKSIQSNECCWIHILDVLESPKLKSDESFFATDCTVSGKIDNSIVVVASAKTDKDGHCLYVRKVWRANKRKLRFDPIPTTNVVCTPTFDD